MFLNIFLAFFIKKFALYYNYLYLCTIKKEVNHLYNLKFPYKNNT